ncbi:iron-containing alcohol dehydrogenase [candidate division WOR-3 bacterium]|nr:iron-containing alcohol dehydrogenase [candidate division WOR-3 bacterium]
MANASKIDLPSFFEVGEQKIERLRKILNHHDVTFNSVLLLGDRKTFLIGAGPISENFAKSNTIVYRELVDNSDEPNVNRIKHIIKERQPDLVIGFGGGKVLDVAKLAAGEHDTRFISVPTTLSNDGISSPVAVIKNKENIPISHITKAPYGVIVDVDIVKKAPTRHIKAGLGDLISNLSATFDARLASEKGKEQVPETALRMAEAGALNLLATHPDDIKETDFLLMLTRGLIKSGFAMCIVGSSRPASGSEHKISHSMDHLYSPRKTLHGEQTGVAALFTMAVQENPHLQKVKALYEKIAFPIKVKKLYLNDDQFTKVVLKAPSIRPERYTVLEDRDLSANEIHAVLKEHHL